MSGKRGMFNILNARMDQLGFRERDYYTTPAATASR